MGRRCQEVSLRRGLFPAEPGGPHPGTEPPLCPRPIPEHLPRGARRVGETSGTQPVTAGTEAAGDGMVAVLGEPALTVLQLREQLRSNSSRRPAQLLRGCRVS
ncbi:unnamed protein product [Caretta caretta]